VVFSWGGRYLFEVAQRQRLKRFAVASKLPTSTEYEVLYCTVLRLDVVNGLK
jgi:hypothetical protein